MTWVSRESFALKLCGLFCIFMMLTYITLLRSNLEWWWRCLCRRTSHISSAPHVWNWDKPEWGRGSSRAAGRTANGKASNMPSGKFCRYYKYAVRECLTLILDDKANILNIWEAFWCFSECDWRVSDGCLFLVFTDKQLFAVDMSSHGKSLMVFNFLIIYSLMYLFIDSIHGLCVFFLS